MVVVLWTNDSSLYNFIVVPFAGFPFLYLTIPDIEPQEELDVVKLYESLELIPANEFGEEALSTTAPEEINM